MILPKFLYDKAKEVYGPEFVEREYVLQTDVPKDKNDK